MNNNVIIGTQKSIRSCGYNEFWLQDQIVENPSILHLGELEVVSRERKQSSGGRLDILLQDPEDGSMYEVEIMLGDTDETHIIRTIEYWDNEKRKWPKRQHYAVIVAESITKRFYNVVHLLSNAIPIIAIQANIIEANGTQILHFTKILDTYEEPEIEDSSLDEEHNEEYWQKRAEWTLDAAKALLEIVKPVFEKPSLHFRKNYIAVRVRGNNYLFLHKRSAGKSFISFYLSDSLLPEAQRVLDRSDLSYVKRKDSIVITTNKPTIQENQEIIREVAKYVAKSWEE